MKNFVAGFMFWPAVLMNKVVLVRKLRPDWQAGRLNAVGGHIEGRETPAEAMSREYHEETGVLYPPEKWRQFADLLCPNGDRVYFFAAASEAAYAARTTTDEEILLIDVASVEDERDCEQFWPRGNDEKEISTGGSSSAGAMPMYNLPWLVRMAIEALRTGYHYVVEERRPKS